MDEASPCRADNLASHLRLAAQRQGKETAQTRDGECCEPAALARFLFSARVYPNPTSRRGLTVGLTVLGSFGLPQRWASHSSSFARLSPLSEEKATECSFNCHCQRVYTIHMLTEEGGLRTEDRIYVQDLQPQQSALSTERILVASCRGL